MSVCMYIYVCVLTPPPKTLHAQQTLSLSLPPSLTNTRSQTNTGRCIQSVRYTPKDSDTVASTIAPTDSNNDSPPQQGGGNPQQQGGSDNKSGEKANSNKPSSSPKRPRRAGSSLLRCVLFEGEDQVRVRPGHACFFSCVQVVGW